MQYAFGSFTPDRDAALTALVQQVALLSASELATRLRAFQSERLADVFASIAGDDVHRPWLVRAYDAARQQVAAGRELVLLGCSHEPGPLGECVVAFLDRARCEAVRPGDEVCAGVAVSCTPGTGLGVAPRLFRKVCSNGAVIPLPGVPARAIDSQEIADAMAACLCAEGFTHAMQRCRQAAFELVGDAPALVRAARTRSPEELLLGRWRRQGDRSLWGLVNAATSLAHADPRWADRLDRERDAERLLAAGLARGSTVAASLAALR